MPRSLPTTATRRTRRRAHLLRALVLAQALALALAGGWLLPGNDDVAEPRPSLVADLHLAADAARALAGLAPTVWDDGLARAARQHAAELAARGLLDHASPTPGRHTLADRLARAGSPYAFHGENLALVPAALDPVRSTVDGWLGSPPHRANLLEPAFDRVGFGTAVDARGAVFVVQVLASAPWSPGGWSASPTQGSSTRVTLGLRAERAVSAVVEVAGRSQRVELTRGGQSWEVEVAGPGPWPVRIGVLTRAPDGFTLEEAGEVATSGRWRPADAPRRLLRVSAAQAERETSALVHVRLEAPAAPPGLALLVDGVHRPEAAIAPGRLELALPLAEGAALRLALAEPDGTGRLLVRHAFTVDWDGDALRWAARP